MQSANHFVGAIDASTQRAKQQVDVSSQDGHADKFLPVAQRERDRFRCAMGAAIRFEHLGLRVAEGALRPKPQVPHLGLRVAEGALRPKPQVPTKLRSSGWLFLVFAFALALSGCTGASFNGSVYRGPGYAFRVPQPPASWKRIDVDGKALSFVDESNGTLIAASGRCKVDGEDVPLRSLVQHLFLQFTERDVISEEVVPFDGREALHTVVIAKLDGVPKQFDVWVLKKDGCVYDLYCIADPAEFNDAVGPFREFVRGFATVSDDD